MDFNGDYPGSRVKRLRVDTTADIGGDLTVGGTLTVSGGASFDLKTVHTDDGTAGLPSHSFKDEKSTGMYRSAAQELSFSVGGSKRASVTPTTISTPKVTLTDSEPIILTPSSTRATIRTPVQELAFTTGLLATTPGLIIGDGYNEFYGYFNMLGTLFSCTAPAIFAGIACTQAQVNGPLSAQSIFSTGTVTCGAISSNGTFSNGTQSVTCGAITSTGNFSNGTKTVTCGPISCSSVTSSGPVTCSDLAASGFVSASQISCPNINGYPAYARGVVGQSFGVFFDSGWHQLGFNTPDDAKDITMDSGYLVVTEKGYYTLNARTTCSANIAGTIRACRIRKRNGQILDQNIVPNYDGTQPFVLTATAHTWLTSDSDDWITFDVYVNSVFPNTYDFTDGTYDMHSTAV